MLLFCLDINLNKSATGKLLAQLFPIPMSHHASFLKQVFTEVLLIISLLIVPIKTLLILGSMTLLSFGHPEV